MMETEIWYPIVGFPAYEVSSHGRFRRVIPGRRGQACRVLKGWVNDKGYLIADLVLDGRRKHMLVSRLVCRAFNGEPPTPAHDAAHWDGNSLNNSSGNLRWATRSENMEDARRHGTMALGPKHGRTTKPHKTPRGERHGHAVLSEEEVLLIRGTAKTIGSGRALADRFEVSPATICLIRGRKIWTHLPESEAS